MPGFNAFKSVEARAAELERFVKHWVAPVSAPKQIGPATDCLLPSSLSQLVNLHAQFDDLIFYNQNRLLARNEIEIRNDKVYFLNVNQSGSTVFFRLCDGDDPPVFIEEGDKTLECLTNLSEYLVTFALSELIYWAATHENESGEFWDIDVPAVCQRHGHSVTQLWNDKTLVWPNNFVSFYLCAGSVLVMHQPESGFVSSSLSLDPLLREHVLIEYPYWD